MADEKTLLLWADTETTGLDPDRGALLEVGLRYTDTDLNPLDDGFSTVVGYHGDVDAFIGDMHGSNGLLAACAARNAPSLGVAARAARLYVESRLDEGARVLLAGSSVAFDRRWLDRWMPGVLDGLHHRVFDVSAIDESYAAWRPDLHGRRPERTTNHRVDRCLDDSIRLARRYRDIAWNA